ncbi:MAG: hypothetical protein JJU15_08160 [Pararhodobacter sp.]|nr:hypothetical protein [Pararhodobacter sp.]
MKALIHIGTPKSGTTTIQTFLAMNRHALRAQGFRYEPFLPRNVAQMEFGLAGMIRAGEHVNQPIKQWALGVYDLAAQRALVDRFEAALREGVQTWPEHTFIASSEQIGSWLSKPRRILALDEFLLDQFEDVKYILYLRPQHELIVSSYSERVKRGETLSFDEHFAQRLTRMNWHRLASKWVDAVGADRLIVRLLDRSELLNGDLLDDFCNITSLDRAPLETPPRMNTALSLEEIDLHHKLTRYIPVRNRRGAPSQVFRAALKLARYRLPKPGTRLRLSAEQLAAVHAEYEASNEKLRAAYFPQRATLFTTP